MTESRLKKIVEEIKKIAEGELDNIVVNKPPANPPANMSGAPATTDPGGLGDVWTNKAAPPSGGAYQVVGPIKDMQEAMQTFAALATKYGSTKQQHGPGAAPARVDSRKKQFNDFITEQYLTSSDMKGEEYTPDEKRVAKEQKQPTDLIEMNIVVNGLQRIGGPQSELKADNYWDFRTNNALKNIYAFAYGLVNLSKDFGRTDAQSFTAEDLAKMKENIPEDRDPKTLKPAEKITRAKVLTPLIKKLTKFYENYIKNIAEHPAFTRYIAGDEKMMTLQRGGGDPTALNATEKQKMENPRNLVIGDQAIPYISKKVPLRLPSRLNTPGTTGVSISLESLQNINLFRQLMENMGVPRASTTDPALEMSYIDAIMKHIDGVLSLAPSQKPTPPSPSAQQVPATGGPNAGVKGVQTA